MIHHTIVGGLFFFCSLGYIMLGAFLLSLDKQQKSKQLYFWLSVTASFMCVVYGVFFMTGNIIFAANLSTIYHALFPVLYMILALYVLSINPCCKLRLLIKVIIALNGVVFVLFLFSSSPYEIDRNFFSLFDLHNSAWTGMLVIFERVLNVILGIVLVFAANASKKEKKYRQVLRNLTVVSFLAMVMLIVSLLFTIVFKVLYPIKALPDLRLVFFFPLFFALFYFSRRYRLVDDETKNFLSFFMKNISQGICVLDARFQIVYCNFEFLRMIVRTEREVLGKKITDFVFRNQDNDFFTQANNVTVFLPAVDGGKETAQMVLYSAHPFENSDNGVFAGGIYLLQDMNAYKAINDNIQQKNKLLKQKIAKRNAELNSINDFLRREEKERRNLEKKIFELSTRDHLTGLYNRRFMIKTLEDSIQNRISEEQIYILNLNIDNFKQINDALGYSAGDRLLVEFANRLFRLMWPYDIFGRNSADEFLIILNDNFSLSDVFGLCNKIMELSEKPFNIMTHSIRTSTSIGITSYPKDGDTVEQLFKNVDLALEEAKSRGKNRVSIFRSEYQKRFEQEFSISNCLTHALEEETLFLNFIPQVMTNTHHAQIIAQLETEVYWKQEDGLVLEMEKFLPFAEKTAMGKAIDYDTFAKACGFCLYINNRSEQKIIVTVGITTQTFYDTLLIENLQRILAEARITGDMLELKIAERTLMLNVFAATKILKQIHELGISISLDKFGLESSSLNYLKDLVIDKIKIAPRFIETIGSSKKEEAIILAFLSLGNRLNIDVVAEGVSTQAQMNFLQEHGCHYFQGPHFEDAVLEGQICTNQLLQG